VEYPGGSFADLALFRLAQSAFALGDSAVAREHVARLQRDYPGSSAAREAEAWWADPGPLPPPAAQQSREAAGADRPRDAAPEVAVESGIADEPQVAVQLGAFSVREGAEAVHREVTQAGFSARIVRVGSDGLYRVRVGMFRSSDEAADILHRLQALGFSAALARDAHLEEPIGG
jgi:cell division protein FtsN